MDAPEALPELKGGVFRVRGTLGLGSLLGPLTSASHLLQGRVEEAEKNRGFKKGVEIRIRIHAGLTPSPPDLAICCLLVSCWFMTRQPGNVGTATSGSRVGPEFPATTRNSAFAPRG